MGWEAGTLNTELTGCEAGGTVGAVCKAGGTIGTGCEEGGTFGAGCEWLSNKGNALESCWKCSILVGPGLLKISV